MANSRKPTLKLYPKLALYVTARHVWLACLGVLARVRCKLSGRHG